MKDDRQKWCEPCGRYRAWKHDKCPFCGGALSAERTPAVAGAAICSAAAHKKLYAAKVLTCPDCHKWTGTQKQARANRKALRDICKKMKISNISF